MKFIHFELRMKELMSTKPSQLWTQLNQLRTEKKARKTLRFERVRNQEFCGTGAVLYKTDEISSSLGAVHFNCECVIFTWR